MIFRKISEDWENQHYPVPSLDDEFDRQEQIPTVELKLCEYDKKRKVLTLPSEYIGMPLTFFVKSHHTGKEVRFVPVTPADILFDEDGWDGEQQIYRPLGNVPGVDHMVIYNLY
jgi:hypothetical protein